MGAAIVTFGECAQAAGLLADALGLPCAEVELRRFPDGESLVRVPPSPPTAILYRSLDDPNAKLVELVLAAAALRENGARRVLLVAPYLAYMRQDMAFRPGEAVSQRVIGQLLAAHFDALLTVDPHLHRIERLDQAVPDIPAISLSAAPVLASALNDAELLVGPDSESRQWVEAIAAPRRLEVLIGEKQRNGDREVAVTIQGIERAAGRSVVLVDDVISSGMTLVAAAQLLKQAGARSIEVVATHCLASREDIARLHAAGISRIRATDSVPGPLGCLPLTQLLAAALEPQLAAIALR